MRVGDRVQYRHSHSHRVSNGVVTKVLLDRVHVRYSDGPFEDEELSMSCNGADYGSLVLIKPNCIMEAINE